jgi:hypothetical protein
MTISVREKMALCVHCYSKSGRDSAVGPITFRVKGNNVSFQQVRIISGFWDPDRHARNGATGSLANLGATAKDSVPAFLEAIRAATGEERESRVADLWAIDPKAAEEVLKPARIDQNAFIRRRLQAM